MEINGMLVNNVNTCNIWIYKNSTPTIATSDLVIL